VNDLCAKNSDKFEDTLSQETTTIYWSAWTPSSSWAFAKLIQKNFRWLSQDSIGLHTDIGRGQHLLGCPAHRSVKSDTLILDFPINIHVVFDEVGNPIVENKYNNFINKDSGRTSTHDDTMSNRYAVQFKGAPIFFCEESLDIELFPPYMHNVSSTQYGALTAGKFDIGQWFRPLYIDYMLWNNVREIILKEDEPCMYIKFHTNKRIKLQEFKYNDFIASVAWACENISKTYKDRQSLQQRYDLFGKDSLKKALLQEIKKNLL